ncbi:hypothetical protein QUB29_19460 [Microcoleus sp. B4b_D2]|uniref:hypothetical protein n=1 Tax=Microcoleus sp. B4b_D2 TaxID=3055310 RepID=UPI002FD23F5D
MTTKELVEMILAILGGASAAATAGFTLASFRAKLQMDRLEIDIKDNQLAFTQDLYKTINAGQLEFARKVQQNIENNRVQIGAMRCDIDDIKGVLERDKGMKPRKGFPEESIPPHTDFT